jgi:hypothetical protein
MIILTTTIFILPVVLSSGTSLLMFVSAVAHL